MTLKEVDLQLLMQFQEIRAVRRYLEETQFICSIFPHLETSELVQAALFLDKEYLRQFNRRWKDMALAAKYGRRP